MNTMTQIKSPLSRKAVLVSLNISTWAARKFDREVTAETNRRRGATDDAGRYNKLLIGAEHLKAIQSVVGEAREKFYRYTRPWADGTGILPNVSYAKFSTEFRALKQRFNEVADEFAANFPAYVTERKKALNGLFREDDYPSASEIRSKFAFDTKFANVPDAGDFRSDVLDDDTVNDIRSEIAEGERKAEGEVMAHTYHEIADVVGKMAKKLKDFKAEGKTAKESYFKDSLVENIRELTELLPTFNLTGDAKLAELTSRLQSELCVEDPKTLRDNDNVRVAVQKSAEEILADVEAHLA
jgi:Protein of unknown function (DUF3150)